MAFIVRKYITMHSPLTVKSATWCDVV